MNGKKVFLYYMTRKRRLKRRSRLTQRGVHRKSKRSVSQRGGTAQKPVINLCTGLPHPVNGLEYTTKTEEIVKGQPNPDYKSYFDSNCKPLFYVSTNHSSKSALAKFMILKNPQKVSIVVNKWITLLEPIKAQVIGSSKLEMVSRTNVNPFMDYYAQLQRYKSLFENKSMMSTRSGTNLLKATMTAASTLGKSMDTEALYSDETIMETFNGITQQYKYYSDMPFNMKEFLGFEGIGGWLGTEASRKKSMEAVDSEVAMLSAQTVYSTDKETERKGKIIPKMNAERDLKIDVAKRALVLCLYVFCYLNYMPIPKSKMDEDTINRMIQTLNTFYKQINTFSGGGAPEDVEKLLNAYVSGFEKNLEDLTKEMEKKRAKPIVGGAWFTGIKGINPTHSVLQNVKLQHGFDNDEGKNDDESENDDEAENDKGKRDDEVNNELSRMSNKAAAGSSLFSRARAAVVGAPETPEALQAKAVAKADAAAKAKAKAVAKADAAAKAKAKEERHANWIARQIAKKKVNAGLNGVKVTNENFNEKAAEIARDKRGIRAATNQATADIQELTTDIGSLRDTAMEKMKNAEYKGAWDTGRSILNSKQRTEAKVALETLKNAERKAQVAEGAKEKVRYHVLGQFRQDAAKTEQAAKEYNPKVQIIPVEKKSGKYAIAEKALRDAIKLYNEDKNDIHEQIVTARYQKLLQIAKEDIQTAKSQEKDFPGKTEEKTKQKEILQKELEGWTDFRGEKKEVQTFNPDELDGKILTLNISIKENKKDLDDIKKKIQNIEVLDGLILTEENAKDALEKANEGNKVKFQTANAAATKAVDVKITELKYNKDDQSKKEIDRYVNLLRENASKEREIKKLEASSDLQRGFLSETLSYEKTIAYLYRPKETRDPLKDFYDAIKDGTKTMEPLYGFIDKNVKGTDGKEREDLLDGDENVSDQVLKDYVQANEGENKMRARTHFFMKVLYAFAKDLQKMIKHADMTRFAMNIHNFDDTPFTKNRLKNMKEYLKERSRSETLFSMFPSSLPDAAVTAVPAAGTTKDHKFVRLYNSAEYNQANRMFSLKEAKLEHVFGNTAYFDGHGFVFIQDPAKYRGFFVKYYYDENDYLGGEKMGKPVFEEKEVVKGFLQFGQPKGEEKPKDAYKELDSEKDTLGDALKAAKNYNYVKTTELTKASVATATLAPTLALEGYKAVALDKVANKENAEERHRKLEKNLDEVARKEQVRREMTGGGVAQKKRTESGKLAGVTGGVMLGTLGGVAGTIIGGVLSAFTFSFLAISVALNVVINSVVLTSYVTGKVSGYFMDLVDSSSYLNLGKLADTKSAECKKVVKMLAMNCEQEKDQRANQLLLSVLSNIYNAVDYIQNAEEKFHDRHEYDITTFKYYIETLVSKIKDNPVEFGNQSLYKSMNEPKKMLYFVYAILQKCKPKTLTVAKTERVSGFDRSDKDLQAKIDKLTGKMNALNELIKSLPPTIPNTGIGAKQPNPQIAEKEKEKKELEKEIDTLETRKQSEKRVKENKEATEDLDKDISEEEKTAEQTLKKNEKPIKELLKKNPPIKFDMKEPLEMFKDPKTYLYTRYSGITSGKEMSKTVTLMDGVDMLVPTHLPAAASVFVYKTGQKDETQLAKEAEAKEAADKKAVLAQANAERKSKEAIAKTQAKSAAAATVKAAQIAAQGQIRAQVPRGQNPRGPDKGQNRQNRPQNRPQTNTVTKTRTQRVKNAVTNVTRRVTQGVKNATVGVAGKIGELLGRKPRQVCVKDRGTETCLSVTMKNDKIMIDRQPRQA